MILKTYATFLAVIILCYSSSAEQFKYFDITSADAALAKVVFSKDYPPVLEVALKHAKSQELADLTASSFNQKVIIHINGEVVAEPIVKSTVTGGTLEIQLQDEATAIRLAKSLIQDKENSEQGGAEYPSQGAGSSDP